MTIILFYIIFFKFYIIIKIVFVCGAILYTAFVRGGGYGLYELTSIALNSAGSKKLLSRMVMK